MDRPDGRTYASIPASAITLVVVLSVVAGPVVAGPIAGPNLAEPIAGQDVVRDPVGNAAPAAAGGPSRPTNDVSAPDFNRSDADATIRDDGYYWVGQDLYRSDGIDPGESLEVMTAGGEFVFAPEADSDGEVVFDTEGYSPGEYVLQGENGDEIASFTLQIQEIDMSFASSIVANRGSNTTVDLSITSERASYTQYMTATIDGQSVDPSTLQSVLGEGSLVDADGDGTDDAVAVWIPNDGSLTLSVNASGLPTGNLTITGTPEEVKGSDTASITVAESTAMSASIDSPGSAVAEELGDVVHIPIALQNTDRASVVLGSDDAGYEVRTTVVDENGDGSVTILWNTHLAGHDVSKAFAAAGDDRLADVERTVGGFADPTASIPARQYDLVLRIEGERTDFGFVAVRDPNRAPRSISVMGARRTLPADGVPDGASEAGTVAMGDWLVVRVQTGGIYGYVTRVFDFRGTDGVSLELVPTGGGTSIGVENAEAVFAPSTNTVWVFWNTSADDRFAVGTTYEARFVIDADENPHIEETVTHTAEFTVESRNASIDGSGDTLRIAGSSGAEIGGTSTLADGTQLTVVVRGEGGSFERSRTVTVQDGTWTATFDLSDVQSGTAVTVEVSEDGRTLATADGTVVDASTPSPTPPPTTREPDDGTPSPTSATPRSPGTTTPGATPSPTSTGTPGFGLLAGVAALLAAALLAGRRRG